MAVRTEADIPKINCKNEYILSGRIPTVVAENGPDQPNWFIYSTRDLRLPGLGDLRLHTIFTKSPENEGKWSLGFLADHNHLRDNGRLTESGRFKPEVAEILNRLVIRVEDAEGAHLTSPDALAIKRGRLRFNDYRNTNQEQSVKARHLVLADLSDPKKVESLTFKAILPGKTITAEMARDRAREKQRLTRQKQNARARASAAEQARRDLRTRLAEERISQRAAEAQARIDRAAQREKDRVARIEQQTSERQRRLEERQTQAEAREERAHLKATRRKSAFDYPQYVYDQRLDQGTDFGGRMRMQLLQTADGQYNSLTSINLQEGTIMLSAPVERPEDFWRPNLDFQGLAVFHPNGVTELDVRSMASRVGNRMFEYFNGDAWKPLGSGAIDYALARRLSGNVQQEYSRGTVDQEFVDFLTDIFGTRKLWLPDAKADANGHSVNGFGNFDDDNSSWLDRRSVKKNPAIKKHQPTANPRIERAVKALADFLDFGIVPPSFSEDYSYVRF